MHVDEISRQQFSKPRGFQGRMSLTEEGLVLGAGTLLAKLDGKAVPMEADQTRLWTLLAVAYGEKISQAVFGSLRRVAKHWQGGDKCLAAIHLAQTGLPEIGEDAAYRLSLAAELIDAGIAPRELARELGLNLIPGNITKYWEDEPRVPAGSGRTSGEWTVADASGSTLTGGRSVSVRPRPRGARTGGVHKVPDLPKDAVPVKTPKGTTIDDPKSSTGKLMAPPRANFQEVYAAGEKIANWQIADKKEAAQTALQHFGTYDFQRDNATNTVYSEYADASNYAVGVYMRGAGYGQWESVKIAQTYSYLTSLNPYDKRAQYWTEKGWDDADQGVWQ